MDIFEHLIKGNLFGLVDNSDGETMPHNIGMHITLLFLMALTCLSSVISFTRCQDVSISDAQGAANPEKNPTSKENEILDFYAFGADLHGNSIVALRAGGFVTFGGKLIEVMPWHVSYWPSQNIWIVSLVNVSRYDFFIINLYLDGSFDGTPSDGFWIYEYAFGTNQWVGPMVGTQRLNYTTVKTPSIAMPKIELFPYAKVWNALRASGPSFSVDAQRGYLTWDNKNLTLHPILNLINITDADNTWHELWALLIDPVDNGHYFTIFYMCPPDTGHVKGWFMLRLDDYMLLMPPTYTIDAQWNYVAENRQGGGDATYEDTARRFDVELLTFVESIAIIAIIILTALITSMHLHSRLE